MTTINEAQQRVQAFHEHYGVSPKAPLGTLPLTPEHQVAVRAIASNLAMSATYLETPAMLECPVSLRTHLLCEELAELVSAMVNGDIVSIADAMGDLLYVLLGTAATFDVPLEAIFDEVHRSNMTKTRRSDDAGRIRDKGTTFVPPDIRGVLMRALEQKGGE